MLRAEPCPQATQLLSTALQLRMCLNGCIHASSDQGAQSIDPDPLLDILLLGAVPMPPCHSAINTPQGLIRQPQKPRAYKPDSMLLCSGPCLLAARRLLRPRP